MRGALAALAAMLLLAGCGAGAATPPPGVRVLRLAIQSRLVGRELHPVLVLPRGGARGRELVVFLHGRGADPASLVSRQLFDALRALGSRAPAVLLADGGDHSYWHDRRDGRWGSSVLREQLPAALARARPDPRRIAIGGISMGGFGALDLARLAPGRFCAVGGHSAALWFRGDGTAPGAFDDTEDFARHDLLALAAHARLYRVPVWLDVGRDDPFAEADAALARELRAHGTRVTFRLHGGGHGGWNERLGEYLRFYVRACR